MRIKAISIAILALTSSHAALAAGNPWKITEAAGQVQIIHGSARTEASRGATLAPRDVIETGANGRAVIARGSDVVFVSPRTRLTIAPEEQARGLIQIIQDLGRATFMIERKANPHFARRHALSGDGRQRHRVHGHGPRGRSLGLGSRGAGGGLHAAQRNAADGRHRNDGVRDRRHARADRPARRAGPRSRRKHGAGRSRRPIVGRLDDQGTDSRLCSRFHDGRGE